MSSFINRFGALCVGVFAAALAACTSPGASQCEATGVLCPVNFHCAAAEPVCISDLNLCGNAHMDPGEICDDGNTKDGDGCSADCKSDESCGNGTLDTRARTPEVCDDGNTRDGDGCSHDCLSKELCGNGIVDVNEVCDDGNNEDGDGCSHDCQSKELCGNGVIDRAVGEVCEPPGTATCSPDCRSTLACGNKQIDPGEECDEGQADNGPTKYCRSDCLINRCGDGFFHSVTTQGVADEHLEECDGAQPNSQFPHLVTPTNTPTCNSDCTVPSCGDGKVNPTFIPKDGQGNPALGPEQCDPPNPGHGCSVLCQFESCGNHVVDPGEECDDGDTINGNGCDNNCKLTACGNGIKAGTEECDDANTANGDGCTSLCKIEFCGDHVQNNNGKEDCDTGGASATCNANCTIPSCGDGIVNASFTPKDGQGHPAKGPEQCDPPNVGHGCSALCQFESCGNGVVDSGEECDDGDTINGNGCDNNCKTTACGNGIKTSGEECDDGNKTPGDGCNATCHTEFCGDGVQNNGGKEACDTGGDTATCNANCSLPSCGDGIINRSFIPKDGQGHPAKGGEECEPPSPGNGCSALCQLETCGNGTVDPGEQCDDGDTINGNGCDNNCTFTACGNGVKTTGEDCDDGNKTPGDGCNATCHTEFCGDGVQNNNGKEQCDTGGDSQTCNANCKTPSCGDHIVNVAFTPTGASGPEQCDPPNVGHGCSALCRLEVCGNGVQDPGEECDDGNLSNTDACTNDCKNATCGDTFVWTGHEDCDDGNTITETCSGYNASCTVCSATCHSVAGVIATCGDGNVDNGHEICDNGNAQGCGTCDSTCQEAISAEPATGLLLATAGNAYTDGDSFTLDDGTTGLLHSVTFEFDNDSHVSVGATAITFTETNTNDESTMAVRIADAINASGLRIDATRLTAGIALVTLTNRQPSASGNKAVSRTHLPATFFLSATMAGGTAGNCANGIGCQADADCKSNRCDATSNQCVACTLNTQCATALCKNGQCELCTNDGECGIGRTCNEATGVCH